MKKKKVAFIIEVPDGKYCWDWMSNDGYDICYHFDNEGGYGTCNMGFFLPRQESSGSYPKSDECLKLKEIK